jgi:hypothetical protein
VRRFTESNSNHFHDFKQNTTKQDDEDTRTSLLLIAPVVAASGLRGPRRRHAILAICSSPPVRKQRTRRRNIVKYQCMFDQDESRRRHEIDLPEAFLKEHQRIISRIPFFASRRCHHEAPVHVPDNADNDSRRDFPGADWLEKWHVEILTALLPTERPLWRAKPSFRPRVWRWT